MLPHKIKLMKSIQIPENFSALRTDECINTYGGNTCQDFIFFPVAAGVKLGNRFASNLAEFYLKYSLFLNF
jgi:hypothetical protein